MGPQNETRYGLVTDANSAWLCFPLTPHFAKGKGCVSGHKIASLGGGRAEQSEESLYHQAALLQWGEDCRKPPLLLEEEAVWHGPPFISEGNSPSACLRFSSLTALHSLDAQCSAALISARTVAIWLPGALLHDWSG